MDMKSQVFEGGKKSFGHDLTDRYNSMFSYSHGMLEFDLDSWL